MKRIIYILFLVILSVCSIQAQDSIPRNAYKSFINLSAIGILSTNRYYYDETTNNISIGLLHAGAESVYGFSFAPFNYIKRSAYGLQLGFINLSDSNDFSIGLINIIKNGDMNVGWYTDEMSNVIATFRSGGVIFMRLLGWGVVFLVRSHLVIEGGIGAHLHLSKQFRIDTEMLVSDFSIPMVERAEDTEEEYEERRRKHDSKQALRASIRIIPIFRFGNHL